MRTFFLKSQEFLKLFAKEECYLKVNFFPCQCASKQYMQCFNHSFLKSQEFLKLFAKEERCLKVIFFAVSVCENGQINQKR